MKGFILFLFSVISFTAFSSGGYITISSSVPANLNTCGDSKLFSITITNPSPFTLTNVSANLVMPTGVNYQLLSVSNGSTSVSSNTNSLTFTLNDLSPNSSVIITYSAMANCNIINYLTLGSPVENNIQVNYNVNSTLNFDSHTSSSFTILQSNLSITNITNQSYIGIVGGTFTRCISITNGGTGDLSSFYLSNTHNNSTAITAISLGTKTNSVGVDTYFLSGADFTGIGNNNTIFESGETVTICETVTITNCNNASSAYNAYWGCDMQSCQNSISGANITFANTVPNLTFIPNSSVSSCMGTSTANQHTLSIQNIGSGEAVNTFLQLYQATSPTGYNAGLNSEIDASSITIQINNGSIDPIGLTSSSPNALYSCLSPTAIGAANITIPSIVPGATVVVRFVTRACCTEGAFNGWAFSGNYYNTCGLNYPITPAWGAGYNHLNLSFINDDGSPSTLVSGQSASFGFITSGSSFNYPLSTDAYVKINFTLTPCVTYSPNSVFILNAPGSQTYIPSSLSISGNVVSATFTNTQLTNLYGFEKAQIKLGLSANCASCSGGGSGKIKIGMYFSTSQSCSCEIPLVEDSIPLNIVCPVPCEGLNFMNFSALRTSYGKPDNDNDGIADAIGSLDFTKIKTNRLMYGDTVTTSYYGKIKTSLAHPNWTYCYANSTITNGNYLTSLGGVYKLYRQGLGLIASCNIGSVTPTTPTATFKYDLSAPALIGLGCLSSGFTYIDNDSIVFEPKYQITSNIGGTTLDAIITNTFITSDIAAPTNTVNMYSCNTFQGKFTIIGYYYTTYAPDALSNSECNQVTVSNNYYLSVGVCCSNYAGGNIFPFEYRYWARIDTLKMTPPVGYKFISAAFVDTRTAGTGGGFTAPTFSIIPINAAAPTWEFPVGSFFAGSTPSIQPSDDGFYGTFSATLEPSCVVTTNSIQPMGVGYDWIFKPSGFLPQDYNSNRQNAVNYDNISYTGPNIVLQSLLPSINANNNVVSWQVGLTNGSSVNSLNTWISAPTVSGVSINTVVDLATNNTLTPVGGIYQIGTLASGSSVNYQLYGTYSSCFKDSVIIHAGWNCQNYPVNLSTYPCNTKKIKLTETPLLPLIISNVITPSYTVDLCDTASYEVIGTNVQLGSAYNLTVSVNIPSGSSIVPGSTELAYPASSSYTIIGNPTYIGGSLYQYNISSLYPSITTNGLPGILSTGNNTIKLKLKVTTACGYTAGSLASFSFFGKSSCGGSTGAPVSLSSQLGITGVSTPYYTNTSLKTTYTSPCYSVSTMNVKVKNLSGANFGTVDSIEVKLPFGTSFVNSSFASIHNPPSNANPVIQTSGASQVLVWSLPAGVTVGDSTNFTFQYLGDATKLNCNISYFEAYTRISTQALCVTTGSLCGVNVLTGGDTLPVFTYKSDLDITGVSGYLVPNSPSGESAIISYTINNSGQTLSSTFSTTISYYTDVNSNGIYDVGDIFISNYSLGLPIGSNSSANFTHTLSVPAGSGCKIVATLDTNSNKCSCSFSSIPLNFTIKNFANDQEICSGNSIPIGNSSISGYTYSWTPTVNLSSGSISNPIYTAVNSSSAPITTTYVLTVNRINCIATDTAIVIVNPIITNSIVSSSQNILCFGETATITAITAGGVQPYTYNWQANTSNTNTAFYAPGSYSMMVVDTRSCNAGTQNFTVTQPTSSLTIVQYSISTTCLSKNSGMVSLKINGGTKPYNLLWSNNNNTDTLLTNLPSGSISLVVTDNNGCIATYSNSIEVKICSEIVTPTFFTPNGDGINDYFVIKNISEFPNNEITIFNRWGSTVYNKKNYDNSWNGKSNVGLNANANILPAGTYFIIIDFGTDLIDVYKSYIELKY